MPASKKLLPLAAFLVGLAIVAGLMLTRAAPEAKPMEEVARIVEAIRVETMTVVPVVTTYGEVAPDRTWNAVSQVAGRVTWKSPKLKNGEFFREGDELLRIDDTEYHLAISRNQAEIEKTNAKITELESNRENTKQQLELLRQTLEFDERELARQQNLYGSRAVSASVVEQQEMSVLEKRRSLASLQADYDSLPSQIAYQKAELTSARAGLQQAELDLTYTVIKAPFTGRVDDISVEERQYVPAGQTLAKLDSIAEAEITIGVSSANLAMLAGERVERVVENIAEQKRLDRERHPTFTVISSIGANGGSVWEGRFGRISAAVDPTTRMIEMVVVVDQPYRRPEGGRAPRPPLSKGTFCTVLMQGRAQPGRIVVPRSALHEGFIYLVNADSRLEIRPAAVTYYFDKYAVIESGVAAGETLVASDLVPAVAGMLLDARMREGYYEQAERDIGKAAEDAADA